MMHKEIRVSLLKTSTSLGRLISLDFLTSKSKLAPGRGTVELSEHLANNTNKSWPKIKNVQSQLSVSTSVTWLIYIINKRPVDNQDELAPKDNFQYSHLNISE